MSWRILIRIALVLAVLAGIGFAAVFFLRTQVVAARVVRDTAYDYVPATLTVSATQDRVIRSEVGGRVKESFLEFAAVVPKDGVLVQLDTEPIDITIAQIESEMETKKKTREQGSPRRFELANAKQTLANLQRNLELNSVGAQQVEAQRRAVEALEDQIARDEILMEQDLATLETRLKQAKLDREKMTITSPIDAVISDVYVYPGYVVGGGADIARLVSRARTVEAKISEESVARVKIGQKANARFLSYPGEFKATVAKILPASDPQTQRYRVFLDVEIEPERLIPGITGECTIVIDQRPDALLIPRVALVGENVFAVADGKVEVRRVEIGFRSEYQVEVRSGLQEGDLVIIDELDRVRAGDRVRVEVLSAEKAAMK